MSDTRSDIAFLYRRAGFGLSPQELDRLVAEGYEATLEGLLAGLDGPDPTGDALGEPNLPAFQPLKRSGASGITQTEIKDENRLLAEGLRALQNWWMDRMIVTSTPLREKLTLFWHGHFATGVSKVRDPKLMYLQNQTFRSLGSGSFAELTEAVAKDGAMMIWLDTVTDKRAHPNENFAREMMELFTLGLGNYTQADVTAAAEAFTGWSYDHPEYRYVFNARQHDFATKDYLGQVGPWNGTDVVRIAVNEAASHRFVLAKLWSYFAYPVSVGDSVVTDLLGSYLPQLSIKSALRAIFTHPAFLSPQSRTGIVKPPVVFLAGAARALGLNATLSSNQARSGATLAEIASRLGQELFNPPNVGGWGQNSYWLDSATALARLDAAFLLARRADLSSLEKLDPPDRVNAAAATFCLDAWGPTTSGALAKVAGSPVLLVALALCAPEHVVS
jgi:uncharacterized protein (DUF1800 family)